MIKELKVVATAALTCLFLVSCWPSPHAGPKSSTGKPFSMYVLVDRGIEKSFTAYQVRNRNQTAEYMEKDLERMLEKAGYAPTVISTRSQYKAGAGSYLLTVKITHYNPGAKALRMYVGYGAGSASMETHYELYAGQKRLLSDNTGAATGQAWEKAIRRIDVTTIDAVSSKLGGGE